MNIYQIATLIPRFDGWRVLFFMLGLLCSGLVFSTNDEVGKQGESSLSSPPNIGNFALPSPQQPAPLLSFGQTLIGRNHLQLALTNFSP